MGNHRLQPIVPARGPSRPRTKASERQLRLVHDDEQVEWIDLEIPDQSADGFAAVVHERQRLGEQRISGPPARSQGVDRLWLEGCARPAGQLVEDGEPDVVAGAPESRARISKTDD